MTSGAPSAPARSCAESPIRRSSPGSPSILRICGASHGSGAGSAGQTPSFKPPSSINCADCNFASSKPQMNRRGWPPSTGRTATPSINWRSIKTIEGGVTSVGPSIAPFSSRSNKSAAARPSGPCHAASPARVVKPSRRQASTSARLCADPEKPVSSGANSGATLSHQPSAGPRIWACRRSPLRKNAASPANPSAGRGPRRAISRERAPSSQSSRASPFLTSGCLSSASSATGANRCVTASAKARIKVPGGVALSGCPAESSAVIPHRLRCADTRSASARSGVISAAVRPGISNAPRIAIAIACASSAGVARAIA